MYVMRDGSEGPASETAQSRKPYVVYGTSPAMSSGGAPSTVTSAVESSKRSTAPGSRLSLAGCEWASVPEADGKADKWADGGTPNGTTFPEGGMKIR
jgi:hypothetical protein